MEANADGQEEGGGGYGKEGQGRAGRRWQEQRNEWKGSCEYTRSARLLVLTPLQFTYNPEWFEDEEEEEEEEWDLAKYRKEKEDEDIAAEEERIRHIVLDDGTPIESTSADGD